MAHLGPVTGATLVTGAGGFIGRHVVAALTDADVPTVAILHRWADADALRAAVSVGTVERCIHLGWYADPLDYLDAVDANLASLRSSLELLALLGELGTRHLVVAGTGAEYSVSSTPHSEDEPVRPTTVYGAMKAALWHLLDTSARPPGLEVAWARLFNVTGPGEDDRRLVPWVARSLAEGMPVALTSGDQQRDYLDVADVADALVRLSRSGSAGTFNVCSGRPITIRALLERLGDRLGKPELLHFGTRPRGANDPDAVLGRPDRLRAATGWHPRYDTDAMIDRVVDDVTRRLRKAT